MNLSDDADGESRQRSCGTIAPQNASRVPVSDELVKTYLMEWIAQVVEAWLADWKVLPGGEVWVRFRTGEVYLLGATAVARL